jgi:tetratricopeptide (TPR) repeat protein
MGGGDAFRCPEPATLAAFVEGKLDASESSVVERHLSECAECVSVAGEATRFLAEGAEEQAESDADLPHGTLGTSVAAIAAVLALVCFAALWWFITSRRDPLHRLRQAAAMSATRSVEPRLANFPYARFSQPRAGVSTERDEQDPVIAEAEDVAELRGRDARAWHARGVAALLLHDDASAARCLTIATSLAPEEASYWNDLSASEIARDGGRGDARTLQSGMMAADHALVLAPAFAAAFFNRGLASERLGLRQQAIDGYARALRLEPRSSWASETRTRMRRLQQ